MKKIIFVCDSLRIGGIQRSLVNLLNNINLEEYSVDLFLFYNGGEYKKLLKKDINIITGKKLLNLAGVTSDMAKEKGIIPYMIRKILAFLCLIFGSKIVFDFMFLFEPKLKNYDAAISYSNNVNSRSLYFGYNRFVLRKILAKKKLAWIHVDYPQFGLNNCYNNREYEKFHNIINVSKATKNNFDKMVPSCKGKSEYIYNIIPKGHIIEAAKMPNPYAGINNRFKIVSVCRLDENKSADELVRVAYRLKESNIDFIWYIVGDGSQYAEIKEYIEIKNLKDNVYLIGNSDNPYPYICNAELFVSASKSESFGISIAEALVLNIPVVATYYPALSELIKDGVNGLIVDNKDESLFNAIKGLIKDKNMYEKIKENASLKGIDNNNSLEKLYKLLNSRD